MIQKFFDKFVNSEKKEAQEIRDDIYSLIKKHFQGFDDMIIQSIYIDLVLVFFNVRSSCICFPLETKEKVPLFVSDLQTRIPIFGFLYDDILSRTGMVPIVVFNHNNISMIKDALKNLKKLATRDMEKYMNILSKMLGHLCASEINPKYLQYRVLFSFTYNPKSQQIRPKNIKTEHLACWCRELDGFALKNLVKQLEKIETIFSVYGNIEPVNKNFMKDSYTPKMVRVSEYNINLEIDMKEEQEHSQVLKY